MNKKNFSKGKKDSKQKGEKKHSKDYMKKDVIMLSEVSRKHMGKKFFVYAFVEKIIQTGGPTVFEAFDGSARMPLKAFVSAGERAYPTVEEGDCIKALISIEEFNGELEGNVVKLFKLDKEKTERLQKEMEERLRKKAKVESSEFLVKSRILDKMKENLIEAATEIRLAVLQARPIIVRHHNDTDGYSSGFALERAILPLIEKEHTNPKAAWEYFTRAPCAAPYYELTDSIKDTANSLRNVAKFSNKMPLIIIADNGSTEQDIMGIRQAKIHGADVIVVDHHRFEEDVISKEVMVHINPFLFDESGSAMSAGQMCAELARFINKDVKNIRQIPALAGLADRTDLENPELMEDYLKIAKEEGYSKELLRDLSLLVEYVSAKIRFMESREYIEVVFGEPREQQQKLVELMAPYIKDLDSKGLSIAKDNAKLEEINSVTLQKIMIEESFPGFGFFPKPGRSIGLVHDHMKENGYKSLVTAGIMNTAVTFRATDQADFSVHDFIGYLNENLPKAFVEGGGHKNAGSINFLPKYKKDVERLLIEFIKNKK